jgi:hypothetical protein
MKPSLKQRILHVIAAIGGIAALTAGALPQLMPVAAFFHIAPQVLTGLGAVLALVSNIPTALGIKPAVSPTNDGNTTTATVEVTTTTADDLPPMKPTKP